MRTQEQLAKEQRTLERSLIHDKPAIIFTSQLGYNCISLTLRAKILSALKEQIKH